MTVKVFKQILVSLQEGTSSKEDFTDSTVSHVYMFDGHFDSQAFITLQLYCPALHVYGI